MIVTNIVSCIAVAIEKRCSMFPASVDLIKGHDRLYCHQVSSAFIRSMHRMYSIEPYVALANNDDIIIPIEVDSSG